MQNKNNKNIDAILNKLQVKSHSKDLEKNIIYKAKQMKQGKSFVFNINYLIESFSDNLLLPSARLNAAIILIVGFFGGIIVSNLSIQNELQLIFNDNFITELFFDEDISI